MQSRMSAVALIVFSLVAILLPHNRCLGAYSGGAGTAEDPYQLATAQDLIDLGDEPNDYDLHFILTADIDLSTYRFDRAIIAPHLSKGKDDLVFLGNVFNGFLDGDGYTIRGLAIEGNDFIGLIGKIGAKGNVSRLKLDDAKVQALHAEGLDPLYPKGIETDKKRVEEEMSSTKGRGGPNYGNYVGSLAGESEGKITNCHVMATVVGNIYTGGLVGLSYGAISDCRVGGEVQGYFYCGGLTGKSYGSITRCVSSAKVHGGGFIGGVVGKTESDIHYCESMGEINGVETTGGLAGSISKTGQVDYSSSTGVVSGWTVTGGLVGANAGHMHRCWSRSTVLLEGHLSAWLPLAGGLTGQNSGKIAECFYRGDVTGDEYVGGLCGSNYGDIVGCYSDGSTKGQIYTGGLVGHNNGVITSCYSYSFVSGIHSSGGLVGANFDLIKYCYSVGSISGDTFTGGFIGSNGGRINGGFWDMESSGIHHSSGGAGLSRAESMDAQWLGLQGFHRDPNWVLDPGQDYPRLAWEETPGQAVPVPTMDWLDGQGTYEDPYQLASAGQLYRISKSSSLWETRYYALTADIDLTGYTWTQAIFPRYFTIFRGNNHVISNVTMRGADYLGLFGHTGEETTILNLRLENVDFEGSGSHAGAIVGVNRGQILYSSSSGRVTGNKYVGGLVGSNKGYLAACFSAGEVHGSSIVGGLAGEGRTIHNCYSISAVYGRLTTGGLVGQKGELTNCYATGPVSNDGGVNYRGLVGDRNSAAIDSYWDVQTSGHETCYAGQGLSTSQMQDINTYLAAGWDFTGENANGTSDFWYMPETGGYPRLSVFDCPASPEMTGQGTAADPYLITNARELGAVWRRPLAFYRLETSLDLQGIQWHEAPIPWFNAGFDGNGQELRNLFINGEASLGLFRTLGDRAVVMDLNIEDANILGTGEYVAGLAAKNYGSIENVHCSGSFVGARRVGALAGINYNRTGGCSSAGTVLATSDTVGGLIGTNRSDLINCQSECVVTCSGIEPVYTNYYGFAGGLVGWNSSYNGRIIDSFSTGPVFGKRLTGGLVAGNSGTILNSWSSGLVSGEENYIGGLIGINSGDVSQCSSTGAVDGESWVGGFVGHNAGIITRSYGSGAVTCQQEGGGFIGYLESDGIITDCYSTGSVTGEFKVGGFVGNSTTETVIANCYSTGFVIGTDDHGGFSGDGEADIDHCFWDSQTSGQTWSNDGRKLPTEQMQNINTYINAGWDFINETANGTDDIWFMPENDYPHLSWELPEAE